MAGLASLVPPPRFNLVSYYGVFASQHRLREEVASKGFKVAPLQLKLSNIGRWLDADGVEAFCFVQRKGARPQAKSPRRVA